MFDMVLSTRVSSKNVDSLVATNSFLVIYLQSKNLKHSFHKELHWSSVIHFRKQKYYYQTTYTIMPELSSLHSKEQ